MTERKYPDMEAASFISKHSLALLLPEGSSPGGVRPVGSGSLVALDERRFILTASHVWAALRASPLIYYSVIAELPHAIELSSYSLTPYSLDQDIKQTPGPFDPDLTLLQLHPADFQRMETRLSFFPLQCEETGPGDDLVTIGSPGVLAQSDPANANTLLMELRAIFVQTVEQSECDGIDFLTVHPYQDPDSPIHDYSGLSGGGLWSVHYYPEKVGGEQYEIFLIGVNFYQDEGKIRCLGRKAIMKLIQKITKPH